MKKVILAVMAAMMMTGVAQAGNLIVKSTAGYVGLVTTRPMLDAWNWKCNAWDNPAYDVDACSSKYQQNHTVLSTGGAERLIGYLPPGTPVSYKVDASEGYGWNNINMPENDDDLIIDFYNSWFNPAIDVYTRPHV